jgi:hypothetical protein
MSILWYSARAVESALAPSWFNSGLSHVKVRSREDASNPALEQLLIAAWKDAPDSIALLHKKSR